MRADDVEAQFHSDYSQQRPVCHILYVNATDLNRVFIHTVFIVFYCLLCVCVCVCVFLYVCSSAFTRVCVFQPRPSLPKDPRQRWAMEGLPW